MGKARRPGGRASRFRESLEIQGGAGEWTESRPENARKSCGKGDLSSAQGVMARRGREGEGERGWKGEGERGSEGEGEWERGREGERERGREGERERGREGERESGRGREGCGEAAKGTACVRQEDNEWDGEGGRRIGTNRESGGREWRFRVQGERLRKTRYTYGGREGGRSKIGRWRGRGGIWSGGGKEEKRQEEKRRRRREGEEEKEEKRQNLGLIVELAWHAATERFVLVAQRYQRIYILLQVLCVLCLGLMV
jgi:hypothetical protein